MALLAVHNGQTVILNFTVLPYSPDFVYSFDTTVNFFVALCGGHQTSTAASVASDFSSVESVTGPPLNPHTLHPDILGQRLDSMILRLAAQNGISDRELLKSTEFLVVALPGIGSEYDQLYTQLALNYIGWNRPSDVYVVDDTDCGLYGGSLRGYGICAIANTGASVLGITETGDRHKFDGWGAVIGDLGSGFDVAQNLFQYLGRQRDSCAIPTLFEEVKSHLVRRGCTYVHQPSDLQLWFDNICRDEPTEWRSVFGELAAVVTAAARRVEPDEVAEAILQAAATGIAETILLAIERFPSLRNTTVCCQGGMFEFSPTYRETVFKMVARKGRVESKLGSYRPITGALLLSVSGGKGMPPSNQVSSLLAALGRAREAATVFRPDLRELLDV